MHCEAQRRKGTWWLEKTYHCAKITLPDDIVRNQRPNRTKFKILSKPSLHFYISGKFRLVRLQRITWICFVLKNGQMTKSRLHNEQIVNRLRKIASSKQQHIYIYTEISHFRLFAANGNGKWKFVFFGQQTINGNLWYCCFSKCAYLWIFLNVHLFVIK